MIQEGLGAHGPEREGLRAMFQDPLIGPGGRRALFETLLRRSPGSLPVETLRATATALPRPLEAILTDAFVAGVVRLHVHPASLVTQPTERPLASPLARLQARNQNEVTALSHIRVRLPDEHTRRLLMLLDGTRDRAALVIDMNGPAFGHERDKTGAFVDYALNQFARLALLCA